MIYPSDFNYYPKKPKVKENLKNIKVSVLGLVVSEKKLKNKIKTRNESKSVALDEPIWIRYCNNSTVHGFRYLTDPDIRFSER